MWRFLALTTLILLSVLAFPVSASYGPTCPYENATYYRPNLVPNFEHLEFSLRDSSTDETIAILDTHIMTVSGTQALWPSARWSANCRYILVFDQYRDDAEPYQRYLGIYDTIEMRQIALMEGRSWPTFSLDFSPDGNSFFLRSTRDGSFLMGDGWQSLVKIAEPYRGYRQTDWRDWDMERREFLVSFQVSLHQVHIFDMDNGNLIQAITQPETCEIGFRHQRIHDNRFLLVYPNFTYAGNMACVNIVDRQTGTDVIINAGERSTYEPDLIALSPDGRYLVIGLAAISVWDLSNLPADLASREALYRHEGPISLIGSITFIDNDTVETSSADGIQRWNIITGAIE